MHLHRALWAPALALVLTGCGGGSGAPAGDGAAGAAGAFLGELRAGRVEPAWEATSAEFKSLMGRDALRELVKKNSALRAPAEFAESRPSGVGLTECVFRGTNAGPKKKPAAVTIRVVLSPAAGGWAVEKLAVE